MDDDSSNSFDAKSASDAGQDKARVAVGLDWAKVQSLAALTGASTLAAVVVLQLSGKTDLPKIALDNVPDSVREALPDQLGGSPKNALQRFDLGAILQNAKV